MKLTQYQKDAVELIRARLDTNHPGFKGDIRIRQALTSNGVMNVLALYVRDTLQLLDVVEGGGYHGQRRYVAGSANRARLTKTSRSIDDMLCRAPGSSTTVHELYGGDKTETQP